MSWKWKSLDNDDMNLWQDDFGIHVQLYRWSDECYFNVLIDWAVPGQGALHEVNDGFLRMNFPGGKLEFERKSAEEFEEGFIQDERGGVEIYLVRNAPLPTNVLEFPISHQGLNFYYQTQGEHTPEKVIGSYAVYHAIKGQFFIDPIEAEKYKAGKAFHLYRPKITDNRNQSAWIDLNIDTEANLMTLTIPQDFLDKAKYPVTIDPNFGYETQGTADYIDVEGVIKGSVFTNNQGAGDGNSISACLYINNQNLKCAIYNNIHDIGLGRDEADYHQTTDERTDIPEKVKDFYTFNFSTQPSISDGTDYLLCCWGFETGGGGYGRLYYDILTCDHVTETLEYGDWPATIDWVRGGGRKYSIYCTFTESAPPTYKKKIIGPF